MSTQPSFTSTEAEEQQRREQQRRANSYTLPQSHRQRLWRHPSRIRRSRIGFVLGFERSSTTHHGESTTAPAATILQGPLDYTQPKGLDKITLLVLCPPR